MEVQGWRLELIRAGLEQEKLLELLELRRKQVLTCPRTLNLFFPGFEEQKISRRVRKPGKVLYRVETMEV